MHLLDISFLGEDIQEPVSAMMCTQEKPLLCLHEAMVLLLTLLKGFFSMFTHKCQVTFLLYGN